MKITGTPTGARFHVLLLACIAAAVTVAQEALREKHHREHGDIQKTAFLDQSRAIQAKWQALRYTSVEKGDFADAILRRIDWTALNLSDIQRRSLDHRLRRLISYLQNPTFEEYYRLKTEGLAHRFEPAEEALQEYERASAPLPLSAANEVQDVLKFFWDGIAERADHPNLPKITAVCLDHVALVTSRTNSDWSIVQGGVAKGLTLAFPAYDPGIRYSSLDGSFAETRNTPLFVHLSVYAKFNDSEYASPLYLSLAWLDPEGTWALSRMITDTWSRVRTMF